MERMLLDKWLAQYNALEKECDRYWDKLEKHEQEGNARKAKRAEAHMDDLESQRKGMLMALEIFGYTVVAQGFGDERHYAVVERKGG